MHPAPAAHLQEYFHCTWISSAFPFQLSPHPLSILIQQVAQIIPLFLISALSLIWLHQEKNRPNTTHVMDPVEHSKNLAELEQGTRLEKSGEIKKW